LIGLTVSHELLGRADDVIEQRKSLSWNADYVRHRHISDVESGGRRRAANAPRYRPPPRSGT
jgi:hypothetical protein